MDVLHKIGVTLAIGTTGAGLISALSKEFMGLHLSIAKVEKALGSWQGKTFLAGAGAATVGAAMLASLKAPLDAAEKWQNQMTKFELFGMGDKTNQQAFKFAQGMNIIGSSYVDNLRFMTEAQGVFRQSGEKDTFKQLAGAEMVAPTMAKMHMIDSTLSDEKRSSNEAEEKSMLRFMEQTGGLQSAQRAKEIMDAGYKMITSSGGNINWEILRQFKTQAGAAGFNLSDEALFAKSEPIIGELKGGAGNALSQIFTRLTGQNRQLSVQAIDMYGKVGAWDMSKIERNPGGGIRKFKGIPLIDRDQFQKDPYAWYDKHMETYYDKNKVSAGDRDIDNGIMFGRSGGKFFSLYEKQQEIVKKSVMAQAKVLGIDQSYDKAKGTITGLKADAATNWENLMILMGTQLIPMVTTGLKLLVPVLHDFASWMKENPGKLKVVMVGFASLAVALTTLGSLAMVVAGVGAIGTILGPIFAGIGGVLTIFGDIALIIGVIVGLPVWGVVAIVVGIGAAIAGLFMVFRHWDTVKSVTKKIGDSIGGFFASVGKWWDDSFDKLRTKIGGWADVIKLALEGAINVMFLGIPGLLKWWGGHAGNPANTGGPTLPPAPRPAAPAPVVPPIHVYVGNEPVDARIRHGMGVGKATPGTSTYQRSQTWSGPTETAP